MNKRVKTSEKQNAHIEYRHLSHQYQRRSFRELLEKWKLYKTSLAKISRNAHITFMPRFSISFFLFNNNHSLLVFCQRIFLVTLNFFFWLWVSSVNTEEDNYSWENRYGILWFKTSSISNFFFIFFQLQSFKNVLLLNKSPTYNDFCDISYFIERLISADWFSY